jgi:hypothetical protein
MEFESFDEGTLLYIGFQKENSTWFIWLS